MKLMKLFIISALSVGLTVAGVYSIHKLITVRKTPYEVYVAGVHLKIYEDEKEEGYNGITNGGIIIMERKDFSVNNLNKIFRWYSLRFRDKSAMYVKVVTDPSLLSPNPLKAENVDEQTRSNNYRRSLYFGALFYRSNNGENEWYHYNDGDPDYNKLETVVLKGIDPFCRKQELEAQNIRIADIELRVRPFTSKDVTPNGIYNTFETKAPMQNDWSKIVTMRSSSQIDLTKKYIYRVNEKVAYFVAQWVYAVTSDGGITWVIWDGMDRMNSLDCCPEDFIESVQILPNGEGEMKLNNRGEGATKLSTKDYGKTWSPQ